MSQSILSVRMDSDTKAAFADFCEQVGMSVSTAINLFARQVVREQRIPFTISLVPHEERPKARGEILSRERLCDVICHAASQTPGIERVLLFGSYARDEARPDSDIDLRIEYRDEGFSLVDLAEFSEMIREATGKPVDVVSARDLGDDSFAESVKRDGVVIYERSQQ